MMVVMHQDGRTGRADALTGREFDVLQTLDDGASKVPQVRRFVRPAWLSGRGLSALHVHIVANETGQIRRGNADATVSEPDRFDM